MTIDKNILYRYFEGSASEEQMSQVKQWAEASEENMAELLSERKLFDTMILAGRPSVKVPFMRRISSGIVSKVACGIILLLGISLGLNSLTGQSRGEDTMTTVTVPAGQRVNVTLPDGSLVWLNSGTTMQYPSKFGRGRKREVTVNGMAYLEVAHNDRKPFVVHTYLMDVQVLGTSFDVNASEDLNIFETALFDGRVQVSIPGSKADPVVLQPDQKISLNDGRLRISKISDPDVYRWKEGLYCFKDKHLSDIVKDLERYYDIEIDYLNDDKLDAQKISGKFRISDGLDYSLNVLSSSLDISWNREKREDGDIIHITAK